MIGRTPRTEAENFLFIITFIWGSTFVVTKDLLHAASPFLYICVRFTVASLLLLAVFPSLRSGWSSATVLRGGALGLMLFAGFALRAGGLQYPSASKSAFITGMLVVFTPVWQVVLERRAPKAGNILGVILVTIGLYLLTSPAGSEFSTGDAMTMICAALFGLYIVSLDMWGKGYDAAKLTMMQFQVSAVGGLMGALLLEKPFLEVSLWSVSQLLYLAIFATVIALYVQTAYQKDTTPTRSAVIFSMEPVIAALFAYVLAGERIGIAGVAGGGVIILGLLISELSDSLFGGRA